MNGKDVFAICDGNVAFQVRFIEKFSDSGCSCSGIMGSMMRRTNSEIVMVGYSYNEEEHLAFKLRDEISNCRMLVFQGGSLHTYFEKRNQ